MLTINPGRYSNGQAEFLITVGEQRYSLYFKGDGIVGNAEAIAPLVMLAAMRLGQNIRVEEACSTTFLANMQELSGIFARWFSDQRFRQVAFEGDSLLVPAAKPEGRVASFFTGGVDSFYTFLKHRDEITDLIYVHGFDLPLEETEKRASISEMGRRIERATGVRFREVETNGRKLLRDWGRWGVHGHGLGLGCIGRLMASEFKRIYIPSSFHERDLFPWSSHPETDVLYSDESIEFVHDGCEAFRAEKLEFISEFSVALENLRVCGEKNQLELNCCRCEKCVRTMTSLYACKALGQAHTFAESLTTKLVRKQIIYDASIVAFVQENIALLERHDLGGSDICEAWRVVLRRSELENKIRRKLYKLRKKVGI
ncbi:hypothetical protein [Pseudomonas fulva]|uniref:Uncharacterized protein n=1 Tax=Pseudomonas fulva (strain 12-X) TaxID=743720 RepID=F6AKQ7_PSEF1|nr:hypothetical protein [Pseudomonas fulva]AEF24131.1 hypothetical protein Psefu_4179 [Pseudomonas fulva 12-X]